MNVPERQMQTKANKQPSWRMEELRLYEVIYAAVTDALLDKQAAEIRAVVDLRSRHMEKLREIRRSPL